MPGRAPSKTISALPVAGDLSGVELFAIVQGGRTVHVTLAQIAAYLGSVGPSPVDYGLLGADGVQLLAADGTPLQYDHEETDVPYGMLDAFGAQLLGADGAALQYAH